MPLLRNDASPLQYCPPIASGEQTVYDKQSAHSNSWLSVVLRDPQFWVPVVVLVVGLVVLRWIS